MIPLLHIEWALTLRMKELVQMQSVLNHAAFQADPLATLQAHVENTVNSH